MTPTLAPSDSPAADVDALLAGVAELERAQRAEDVDGFLALLDADAVWVTGGGRRLVGWEAIAAFTREVLPGAFAHGTVRYDVEHVRFITPDVALTGVAQEYLTAAGQPLEPREQGLPSYIWHRREGRWLITSGQNTGVPVPAATAIGAEDEAAIRAIVADVEAGFNDNDADLLLRHVAEDALIVNAVGHVLRGGDAIEASTRAGLAGPLRDARAHYRVTDIELLAPDVAVAHKSAWATAEAADSGAPPEMNALYVLVRRDGRWFIARRQNTLVA